MVVGYKKRIEEQDASSLQDRTENSNMLVANRQHREQRDAIFLPKDNNMLLVYRQRREQQGASSLQDRTEKSKKLVACRQHREQGDASSLQTGQRTTTCQLLTDNTENSKMLVPYRPGPATTTC